MSAANYHIRSPTGRRARPSSALHALERLAKVASPGTSAMTSLEILVRSVLRKTGVLRVITDVPHRWQTRRYRSQYRKNHPNEVDVQLATWHAKMLVSNENEYAMIRAKHE